MLPKELAYMQLHLIFTTPSWLKIYDWLLLAGPIMKYLLQDFFHDEQRKALFSYLDVLSRLWCHSIAVKEARQLVIDTKEAIADMEMHFPVWDATINRHMIMHIAEAMCV
eukprot:346562-Chlamydomonas_euryale.AAC.1